MEQDTLAEILEVEKAIRDRLESERGEAGKWLAQARSDIEQAHQSGLANLQDSAAQGVSAASQATRDKAAAIVLAATTAARDMDRFQDEELRAFVRRAIAPIAGDAP